MFATAKIAGIAALVAFLAGASIGWKGRDALCDAAHYKLMAAQQAEKIRILESRIKAANEAGEAAGALLKTQEEELERLRKAIDEIPDDPGACLSHDDVKRLRSIR